MSQTNQSLLGLILVVFGLVIFFLVAGEFLLRLILALIALLLVAVGMQLWKGKPINIFIWRGPKS